MPQHQDTSLFFGAQYLPPPRHSYVAWLDVMGIRAAMSRSLSITANFVFKLHIAALEAPHQNLSLYPVMDGMYVVADRKRDLTGFLSYVFERLANAFVAEPELHHRFVAKAAVAFGPVIHGVDVPRDASWTLDDAGDYKGALLLGMPMVQAVQGESKAPPFGVYIHESARAFATNPDQPFTQVWWRWWRTDQALLRDGMRDALTAYYDWAEKHHSSIEYNSERLQVHRGMATEYFQPEGGQPPGVARDGEQEAV